MILTCNNPNCHHNFQDLRYGYKRRVHNKFTGKNNEPMGRCTVCGHERPVKEPKAPAPVEALVAKIQSRKP